MKTLDKSLSLNNFIPKDIASRRQDVPNRLNGDIYLCEVDYYLKYQDLYGEKSYAHIMDKKSSIDVDDEIDFIIAEAIMKTQDT